MVRAVTPQRQPVWTTAIGLLLAVLWLTSVYRAVTQSVVYDEAFTYNVFLAGPVSLVFTEYTANNHVLFSLLARSSVAMFGPSPVALRLPAVMFGALYFLVSWLIARNLFVHGPLRLVAVAALVLNPLVLDFLTAARGYGTALALFMAALLQLTRCLILEGGRFEGRWAQASLMLGLSVSANLTFGVPAACLMAVALVLRVAGAGTFTRSHGARHARTAAAGLVPGVLTAFVVLVGPLSHAKAEHFFYGTASLQQTTLSLIEASLRHGRTAWPADPLIVSADATLAAVQWLIVLPSLLLACVWMVARLWDRRASSGRGFPHAFALLVIGTFLTTLIAMVALHALAGVLYPFGRTGLWLLALFTAVLVGLASVLEKSRTRYTYVLSRCLVAVLTLAVLRFASEFTVSYFHHWRYDAGTADLVTQLEGRQRESRRPLRVAVAELFAPSIDYYRTVRPTEGIDFVSRGWVEQPEAFDFFIVSPASAALLGDSAGRAYVHPTSGAVLMERRASDP